MPKVTKNTPDPPSILQKLANMYNWRENLAENIVPYGYDQYQDDRTNPKQGAGEWVSPMKRLYNTIVLDKDERLVFEKEDDVDPFTSESDKERIDLLNMFLDRNQKHNTIQKSKYKPTEATNTDSVYYQSPSTKESIKQLLLSYRDPDFYKDDRYGRNQKFSAFMTSPGQDEKGHYISYYDKWDLNPVSDWGTLSKHRETVRSIEDSISDAVGLNPTEIYDRIYYDPKTGKPIESKKHGGKVRLLKK